MKMTEISKVEIVDVTARDGLQNESVIFSTPDKVELIEKAVNAGARRIEVASFAHPKYVPQMADAEAVIAALPDRNDVIYIGLAMNERGVERALKTKIDEVGLVVAASDIFAKKNQNQTRESSVKMACAMVKKIKSVGRRVNVTIATAFGCPFEGEIQSNIVVDMCKELAASGPDEIALADTIGVGNPWQVRELFTAVNPVTPNIPLRAHFHNTRNTGLANIYGALQAGIRTVDVSIGGIGGCPFAPAATGNVPSEDVVYMLERHGIHTGMTLEKVILTTQWLSKKMNKPLHGMVSRAGDFP